MVWVMCPEAPRLLLQRPWVNSLLAAVSVWGLLQGQELKRAVTEGLRAVNLLADKAADKLVSSYR